MWRIENGERFQKYKLHEATVAERMKKMKNDGAFDTSMKVGRDDTSAWLKRLEGRPHPFKGEAKPWPNRSPSPVPLKQLKTVCQRWRTHDTSYMAPLLRTLEKCKRGVVR